MIRNFLKITLRNFLKNKPYVIINLIGLGLSSACCIVGYLNYKYSADFDKSHLNHHKIYKVHAYKKVQDSRVQIGITPMPLGSQIKDRYPSIEKSTRYARESLVLKKELKVFNQSIGFAEPDFLEIFTFPLLYGNASALSDPSKILLSKEVAESYFGKKDPTGEIIYLIKSDGMQMPMTIGGVFKRIPQNSSIRFSGLTSFDNYFKVTEKEKNDWSDFIAGTFVMTFDGEYPQNLLNDVNNNFVAIQNEARQDFKFSEYYLVKLSNLGQHVIDMPYNWLNEPPPPPAVTVPFIMAGIMLLIACFNFTNTSIAISSKRLKEIGIRKVMGGSKKQLIFQFMGENLFLSFLALLLALLIAYFLVPAYNALWEFIDIRLDLGQDPEIYGFLLIMLIVTSLVAGGYPSVYISQYQPVNILRGSLSLGGANLFSRLLLGLQYLFTIIGLISSFAFANNAKYQSSIDIGFAKDHILGVRVNSMSEFENYSNLLQSNPEVEKVVGSSNHIGWWHYIRNVKSEGKEIEASFLNLGIDYKDIMDLEILEGRYFEPDLYEYDRENAIIINEEFVKEMKWENPIGKTLTLQDTLRLNVVGVMKNFYQYGFFEPVLPSGFRLSDREDMNFVVIKSQLAPTEFYDQMETIWYEVAPDKPFNATFQSEAVDQLVIVNRNVMKMFLFLGFLALILSSIGLYTLVSLNMIKRVKEIGVRKVLGATIQQILVLMNKQFFWLLFIFT
ncbi:MAG: FtsX-like permease family protein, partial [Bacteroidota bacterium]